MPFIIVSREGDSVRLVSETAFQHQEDAIDAITSALSAGALERGTGFLLLDMERAMPVAVVQVAEPPTLRFDEAAEGAFDEASAVVSLAEEVQVIDSEEHGESGESHDVFGDVVATSVTVDEGEEEGILDRVAETVPEPEPLIDLTTPLEVPAVDLPEVELPNLPAEEAVEFEATPEGDSFAAQGSDADDSQIEVVEDTQAALEDVEASDDLEVTAEVGVAAELEVSENPEAVDVVEATEDTQEPVGEGAEVAEQAMAAALDELLDEARLDTDLEEVGEDASEPGSVGAEMPLEVLTEPLDVTSMEGTAEELPRWPWDAAEPEEAAQGEDEQIQSTAVAEPQAEEAEYEEQPEEAAEVEPEDGPSVGEPEAVPAPEQVAEASEEESGHEDAAVAEAEVIVEAEAVVAAMESNEVGVADAPGYEAGDCDLSALTCVDCVYVNTCPNREERTPATCGSFQWTSV